MPQNNKKLVIKRPDGYVLDSMEDVQPGETVMLYEPGDSKGVEFTLHEKKPKK